MNQMLNNLLLNILERFPSPVTIPTLPSDPGPPQCQDEPWAHRDPPTRLPELPRNPRARERACGHPVSAVRHARPAGPDRRGNLPLPVCPVQPDMLRSVRQECANVAANWDCLLAPSAAPGVAAGAKRQGLLAKFFFCKLGVQLVGGVGVGS